MGNLPHRPCSTAYYALSPEIATTAELAQQFYGMMQECDAWLGLLGARPPRQSPLYRFARELQREEAAVRAALMPPWSTEAVEGHIHRLKLIKRQMYGRAKLDVLRIRVLLAT